MATHEDPTRVCDSADGCLHVIPLYLLPSRRSTKQLRSLVCLFETGSHM